MDLEDLALFRAVVRCQSITRAARLFGMTQSTASRHLQRLERAMGASLLDRSTSPVRPTARGQRLLQFAEVTLDRFEALRVETENPADQRGELRIGASSAPTMGPLGVWLSEFGRSHPGVRVRLSLAGSHAVERSVLAHHVGVGFVGGTPEDCCLDVLPVARDRIRLILPKASAPQGADVDPAWLGVAAFIARDEDSATWEIVRRRFVERGWELPSEPVLVADSAEAQLSAVRAGMGVAFVSEAILSPQDPTIVACDVRGLNLERTLFLVSDPAHLLRDPLSMEFRRFIAERTALREEDRPGLRVAGGMTAHR